MILTVRFHIRLFCIATAVLAWLATWVAVGQVPASKDNSHSTGCAVLLHGLGRTSRSMHNMGQALSEAGYLTINLDYPSRQKSIEQLADEVVSKGIQQCRDADADRIDFVTHSMGGIVLRYYLSRQNITELGRVVMLSPPNQGSEATDRLKHNFIYRWVNGPAGQQLGTGPEDIAAALGPVKYQTGIITGDRHSFFDGWLAEIIPGKDDGKVSVERAKVDGMTDFLVLPYAHSFIMQADEVIAQTLHFLQYGEFRPEIQPTRQ